MNTPNTLKTETKILRLAVIIHLFYSIGFVLSSLESSITNFLYTDGFFFEPNFFSELGLFLANPTTYIISNFVFGIFVLIIGAKIALEINQSFVDNDQEHLSKENVVLMTTIPFWSNFAIPTLLLLVYKNLSLKIPKSFTFIKYGLILNAIFFGFNLLATIWGIIKGKRFDSYIQGIIDVIGDIYSLTVLLNLIIVILLTRQLMRISKEVQMKRNMVVKS